MAISQTTDAVVYVGTAPVLTRSGVFVTTNSGTSWTNITGTLPDRYPVDIAVDPTDDQIAYVVMSGFGSGHLFRTTNRGGTWTDITNGLPDLPSSAVLVDPDYPQILYFGNDIGVYVSTNTGTTWEEFQVGMPDAAIVMDLQPVRVTRYIRAVTHGCGVYERSMLDPSTGVDGGSGAPAAGLAMLAARPNPFSDATQIRFTLGAAQPVTVRLYDVAGRAVATLVDGEMRPAGEHAVQLDARRYQLAAGVYVARIEAGQQKATVRVVLAP